MVIYLLNGLYYAAFIFLISLGLNIILGVMGVLNLAHGSLYAIGAFMASWAVIAVGKGASAFTVYSSLLTGLLLAGGVGLVLEWSLIRPIYERALEYQLLMTFGILLVLEGAIKMVWGGEAYYASAPVDILGTANIVGNPYPVYFLFIIGISLITGLLVWLFMTKTRVGTMLRAVSLDREMATALGLDVKKLSTLAFALGAALAGLAGALVAPTTSVLLGFGTEPLILAFIVVVIGGLGSPKGALMGSLIVGINRSIGIIKFPEIESAILFLIAAIILVAKPQGLFGKK
ncbi:MAG: branched-chain amino acid ABC transporter permease [Nitrospiraceae bacterium]